MSAWHYGPEFLFCDKSSATARIQVVLIGLQREVPGVDFERFRWVLVAPHMEPARGLLGRVLRRRLASLELEQGPQPELAAILGWLPRVWQHLNAFLETHSSGDVAIGPRLFLGRYYPFLILCYLS